MEGIRSLIMVLLWVAINLRKVGGTKIFLEIDFSWRYNSRRAIIDGIKFLCILRIWTVGSSEHRTRRTCTRLLYWVSFSFLVPLDGVSREGEPTDGTVQSAKLGRNEGGQSVTTPFPSSSIVYVIPKKSICCVGQSINDCQLQPPRIKNYIPRTKT